MNIPNTLTVFRVVLVPVFVYFLLKPDPISRIIALGVFFLASISDFFDGYLARKWNQESAFGRFLDPLADKALVISSIFAFVYLDQLIPLWMVLVIIGRDMLITALRFLAIRKGMEVKTSKLGKAKTAFQMISIVIIVVVFIVRSYRVDITRTFEEGRNEGRKNISIAIDSFSEGIRILPDKQISTSRKIRVFAESIPYFVMLLTTWVTIISGIRYIYTNYRILAPPYYVFRARPGEQK